MRLAKTSEPLTYYSIEQAKDNHAFVREYKPQTPFITIEGNKYFIGESWVAHPYYQTSNLKSEIIPQRLMAPYLPNL